ncbi:hypothetical protein KJ590_03705 [Patescibacteria group bacterium]|nr:hypothetical protein [Patescibacteria group bacterium]MBU4143075.1 hypothetical protein [Patescibacteria group bacterium]
MPQLKSKVKKKIKRYSVSYRDEFSANVLAGNREDAIKAFERKINVVGELWPEYFEVTDSKGFEVLD